MVQWLDVRADIPSFAHGLIKSAAIAVEIIKAMVMPKKTS
jgi:hypothetical protein